MGQPHNRKRTRSRPRTRRPALYSDISSFSYSRHYPVHIPTPVYPDDIKTRYSEHLATLPDTLLRPSSKDSTIIRSETSLDIKVASLSSQSWPESAPDLSDCSTRSSRSPSLEPPPTPASDLPHFVARHDHDSCATAPMWQKYTNLEGLGPKHTSSSSIPPRSLPLDRSSGTRPPPFNGPTPTHRSFIDCPLPLAQYPSLPTPAPTRHLPLASPQSTHPHLSTSIPRQRFPRNAATSPPLQPHIISKPPPLSPPSFPSPLRQVEAPRTPSSSPPPLSSRQPPASQTPPQVQVLSKRQQRKLSGDQSEARAAKRRRIFGVDEGDEEGELCGPMLRVVWGLFGGYDFE
ncbi:hypothetical protein KVT40_007807 [Elsinoe batatas]|uniref:Uncharacterized protein n=1 Tax=Elsinoe batatas TaxID=2601811 RepID=A0A8K0KWT8_9PEZI|nr:hypothetical protein KVT40_007807 [Elsinoe batatas]